ncbi:MAG: hypothetical protein JRM80_10440 [Nitrososphaerota archaeon]|nr:hypothetical protein [Nitrososphaerota archaeon]
MKGIPEVVIIYSSIYDRVLTESNGREYTHDARRRGRRMAAKIQSAWERHSAQILSSMVKLSGVRWRRREIRAYLVSFVRYPFSEPLTLWIGEKRENIEGAITFLVHELAHVLLEDSEDVLSGYWKASEAAHRGQDHTTITHIPVHGLMIETLRATFGNDSEKYLRQERWWEYSKANPDMKESYAASWNIVTSEGAASVLRTLRSSSKAAYPGK